MFLIQCACMFSSQLRHSTGGKTRGGSDKSGFYRLGLARGFKLGGLRADTPLIKRVNNEAALNLLPIHNTERSTWPLISQSRSVWAEAGFTAGQISKGTMNGNYFATKKVLRKWKNLS